MQTNSIMKSIFDEKKSSPYENNSVIEKILNGIHLRLK